MGENKINRRRVLPPQTARRYDPAPYDWSATPATTSTIAQTDGADGVVHSQFRRCHSQNRRVNWRSRARAERAIEWHTTPGAEAMPILDTIREFHDELTGWQRDIHAHPELGFEE